jgi:hypothetical protein
MLDHRFGNAPHVVIDLRARRPAAGLEHAVVAMRSVLSLQEQPERATCEWDASAPKEPAQATV